MTRILGRCSILPLLVLVTLAHSGCPTPAPSLAGDWRFTLEGLGDDFGVRINEDGTGMGFNIGTGIILVGDLRAFVFNGNSVTIQQADNNELVGVFVGTINARGTMMSGFRLEGDGSTDAWSAVRIQP